MRKETVDDIKACLNLCVCLVVAFYVMASLSGCGVDFSAGVHPITSSRSYESSYDPKKVRCLWGCNSQEQSNEAQGS